MGYVGCRSSAGNGVTVAKPQCRGAVPLPFPCVSMELAGLLSGA